MRCTNPSLIKRRSREAPPAARATVQQPAKASELPPHRVLTAVEVEETSGIRASVGGIHRRSKQRSCRSLHRRFRRSDLAQLEELPDLPELPPLPEENWPTPLLRG